MSTALFSSSWYRVANVRPKLRAQAKIHRHVYRDEVWYVVQDLASGKFLRLNTAAYRLIALLDGYRTVEEVWQYGINTLADDAPTQDEVITLLSQLHQANLLLSEQQPDMDELDQRRDRLSKQKLKQYIGNPLSLRFPLVDPDRLLTALVGNLSTWAKWFWAILWLAIIVLGGITLSVNWDAVTDDVTSKVFTPEYLLLIWLAFPLLKAIHEFGHGLAIKLFGGQCHEMGVMLLVLMPVPYVDASASASFSNKWQRMMVAAAGMMIELAVASLALWLWSWIQPSVFKSFLHEIVLIAGISTVIFNINPLLRLDGYYILADWLEIPNLGQKANQYVGYVLKRFVLNLKSGIHPPPMGKGEAPWLMSYSVLSFSYRIFISAVILLFVAEQYFFVGVVLAIWAGYLMLVSPIVKQAKQFWQDPALVEKRAKAFALTLTVITALGSFLFVVPFPMSTVTEGIIWMPEQAQVRAPHDCFGRQVLAVPQQQVMVGDPLLICVDPQLDMRVHELSAKVREQEARLSQASKSDRVDLQLVSTELLQAQRELEDAQARQKASTIVSDMAGRFVIPSPNDFEGRYWERGKVVGYVLNPESYSLLVVVPQGQAEFVRHNTLSVELRSVENVHRMIPAQLSREVPAATKDLPSLALALQGGGEIGLDPSVKEGQTPQALMPMFQFELTMRSDALPSTLGSRIYARFTHDPMPLGWQWYRQLRELFMKRFEI